MKLATRISLFFLIAIAAVLLGFSSSIYWIVREHLYRQVDNAAVAALDTLAASIEFTADGLEWEPSERRLTFGTTGIYGAFVWGLFDSAGERVDGSTDRALRLTAFGNVERERFIKQEDTSWNEESWRIARRELQSDANVKSPHNGKDSTNRRYSQLYLVVGLSLEPVVTQLRSLALTLFGVSALVWLIAALLGGWLCRNALSPLTHMSHSISAISPADLSQRLTPIASKDQLGDLSHAFNQLLDRLEVSFERQRRFAADASHQLRTPLTSMLGHVEVALRRNRTEAEYRNVLECVQDQSIQLSQIIEMLLFLAREGADVVGAKCSCFELNEWIDAYLSRWQQHPRFNDIQLDIDRDAELLIRAHKGLLGQAIDNLIDNACKYSELNSTIVIRTVRTSETVILEVEDNGCGIAESELAQVVDPFFRSDDARRRGIGGAGLGLSVAQRIISAIGATLSLESTRGQGSTVKIVFHAELHGDRVVPTLAKNEA